MSSIEVYSRDKHGYELTSILFNDFKGSSQIGEGGVYSPSSDCSYRTYKIVLVEDDKIIGFLTCSHPNLESSTAIISQIYIHKDYRGKGYGKKLIDSTIEYYKRLNLKRITLSVFDNNEKAIRFYEKEGFIQNGYQEKETIIHGQLVGYIFLYKKI